MNADAAMAFVVCRLVAGRVTFVHRRLWPAIVKLASHFHPDQLTQVRQEHTASGRHVNHLTAYPAWVPAEILAEVECLTVHDAEALFEGLHRQEACESLDWDSFGSSRQRRLSPCVGIQ